MQDPFIGAIFYFAGNFAIYGTAMCAGQILPISQNTALFSLLGTQYGGNGTSNFGLPDLRGRAGLGQGNAVSGSTYTMGEELGTENVTLLLNNMPLHNHSINAYTAQGNSTTPSGGIFTEGPKTGAGPFAPVENIYNTTAPNTGLLVNSVGATGGSQPFNIIQPYLALTYLIALSGVFPARN